MSLGQRSCRSSRVAGRGSARTACRDFLSRARRSALVPASALWSMCRLLAGSAACGSAGKAGAREVFGEGLDSSPVLDRGVEGGHFLLHELRAHFAEGPRRSGPGTSGPGTGRGQRAPRCGSAGPRAPRPARAFRGPIQAVKGRERLGAEHAGMVGDLVVIDVVDVDALVPLRISSAMTAVLRSRCNTLVAARRAGEGPSAVNAWQDVEACLSSGLPPLLHDLSNSPDHTSGEPVGVGEEPGERAPAQPRTRGCGRGGSW